MLHPHHCATFSLYISLCPPISAKIAFPCGNVDPINVRVIHSYLGPTDPPPKQHRGCLYLPTIKHVMPISKHVQHIELAYGKKTNISFAVDKDSAHCYLWLSLLLTSMQNSKSLLHFSKFFVNANSDLITNYILRQTKENVSINILSEQKSYKLFTHESNTFFYCRHTTKIHCKQWTRKTPKPLLPLGDVGPHVINQRLGPPKLPPQMAARSPHAFLHNYAAKSPLVTRDVPHSHPKLPLPVRQCPSRVLASSLDLADPPYQMASRSNQSFSTIHWADRQTDGATDRWDRRQKLYQYLLKLYWLYSDAVTYKHTCI